jgi:hypothetical protein
MHANSQRLTLQNQHHMLAIMQLVAKVVVIEVSYPLARKELNFVPCCPIPGRFRSPHCSLSQKPAIVE